MKNGSRTFLDRFFRLLSSSETQNFFFHFNTFEDFPGTFLAKILSKNSPEGDMIPFLEKKMMKCFSQYGLFQLISVILIFGSSASCCSLFLFSLPHSKGQDGRDTGSIALQNIDSSQLERLPVKQRILFREDFFPFNGDFPPPVIAKSDFISVEMVEHLMRNKKDSALGVKYVLGDEITNMEGALHTFVTPVCAILMTGDFQWAGNLQGQPFGQNQVRKVILSAAIHPDFEYDTVIMHLVKIRDQAIEGEPANLIDIPEAVLKENNKFRQEYEEKIVRHLVYHLSSNHRLPALHEISPEQIMDPDQVEIDLEWFIENPQENLSFQDKYMRLGSSIISLEMLFQIYVQQVRNEFKILNSHVIQGYVYTMNPPSIFARAVGGAHILNRFQALAFRSLVPENFFSHLQVLGFSDYADKGMIPLLKRALPQVRVVSQTELYDKNGFYNGPKGLALVLHNNSDAFGQNIQTEEPTSLDGVIGSFSNAASVLKRDRKDLVDFIF